MSFQIPKRRYVTRPIEKKDTTRPTSFRIPKELSTHFMRKSDEYGWHLSMFFSLVLERFLLNPPKEIQKWEKPTKSYETKSFRLDIRLIEALNALALLKGVSNTDIVIAALISSYEL